MAKTTSLGYLTQDFLQAHKIQAMIGAVAVKTRPASVKVFTDSIEPVPFNSFLSYYRSCEELIRDVAFIYELWTCGLQESWMKQIGVDEEKNRLPPLSKLGIRPLDESLYHNNPFCSGRTDQESQRLFCAFQKVFYRKPTISVDDVKQALRETKYEVVQIGDGFMIRHNPFFLGQFIDRIFVDTIPVW